MSKTKPVEYCVADAISCAVSEFESLRDELQEWYDNLPESLQGSGKGDTLQESVEYLGNVDYLSLPDALESTESDDGATMVGGVRFTFHATTKKRLSRRARRDEASALLDCAITAARDFIDNVSDDDNAEDFSEVTSALDELENLRDEVDNAEFPGMYG